MSPSCNSADTLAHVAKPRRKEWPAYDEALRPDIVMAFGRVARNMIGGS